MARSYVLYSGNAVQETFSIPFGYLDRDHVIVSLDDVVQTIETDYIFQSATIIDFVVAPPVGVGNVNVARQTPTNTAVVDFEDGATLLEGDLDNAALQALYATEEALDALDAEEAARSSAINTVNTSMNTINTTVAALDAELEAAVIGAGQVPTPDNPGDDDKVLTASNGSFDWVTPAATGIPETIVDAKGDLIVATAADTVARRAVGANGLALVADSTEADGVKWASPVDTAAVPKSIVDAKGDLIVGTAADTVARRAVGTDGQVLTADAAEADGVKWADAGGGAAPSFLLAPESAAFPAANFPQLKKATGTNWISYSLGFDQTTDEAAYWKFLIPSTAVFTAATLKIVSRQLAATTGTVAWQATTLTYAEGENYDGGTPVVDAVAAETVQNVAGELTFQSQALTVTGWVAGEMLYVKLNRDVSADDVAEDAELVCAMIELS